MRCYRLFPASKKAAAQEDGSAYGLIQFAVQFVGVIRGHGVDSFPLVLNQSNVVKKQSKCTVRKMRTVHLLCVFLAVTMNPIISGVGFGFENPRTPTNYKLIVAGRFSVVNGKAVN